MPNIQDEGFDRGISFLITYWLIKQSGSNASYVKMHRWRLVVGG